MDKWKEKSGDEEKNEKSDGEKGMMSAVLPGSAV